MFYKNIFVREIFKRFDLLSIRKFEIYFFNRKSPPNRELLINDSNIETLSIGYYFV